jgi:hypothetical protein
MAQRRAALTPREQDELEIYGEPSNVYYAKLAAAKILHDHWEAMVETLAAELLLEQIEARERKRTLRDRRRGKGLPDALTPEQWQNILREWNHRCAYCGARNVPLTQDHVKPIVAGGEHTARNVVPACWPCNHRKRANPAPPFFRRRSS